MKSISKLFKNLTYASIILFISSSLFSQTVGCLNSDFELGNFTNWTGELGVNAPIANSSFGMDVAPNNSATNTGRQVIMTGGTDPITGGNVNRVAPGSLYSARLGNSSTGKQTEKLRYQFTITPQSSLIIYKYAVILQDPPSNHDPDQKPRFEAKLIDQNGNNIPCTYYLVVAGTGTSGFNSAPNNVRYLNWQTIGVDASNYIGQTLTLEFSTEDCTEGAHYGYAYVDAGCAPFAIDSRYCENTNGVNSAVLTAPIGFSSYLWSNGATTTTTTIANPTQGQVVTCNITSANGCVATLQAILTPSNILPNFSDSTVCDGVPLVLDNTTSVTNGIISSYSWASSDGFTSNTTDFNHVFPSPGNYTVTLTATTDLGCTDNVVRTVTINTIPNALINMPNNCVGDEVILESSSTNGDGSPMTHSWVVNGTQNYAGDSIPVSFPSSGVVNLQLISTSQFGCVDTVLSSINIYENPLANFSFIERCINNFVPFTNLTTPNTVNASYEWILDGVNAANTFETTTLVTGPGEHTMTLVAKETQEGFTCDDTLTLTFIAHDDPAIDFIVDSTLCEDIEFEVASATTVSTGESLTYSWTQAGTVISTDSSFTYVFNDQGIYPITLDAVTSFGCTASRTFNMYISPTPPAPILAVTTPDCPGDIITFTSQSEANSIITWSGPNNFISNEATFNMPFELNDIGQYSAFIISQYGCVSAPSTVNPTIVNLYNFNEFEFPNVITANNDGINDILDLHAYFQTCDKYKIYIFNRWGHLIYEQTETSSQFMGDTQKGKELEEGVYFYKMEYESPLDSGTKNGFIHVVK
jgi:gliding motility-associated-like protein